MMAPQIHERLLRTGNTVYNRDMRKGKSEAFRILVLAAAAGASLGAWQCAAHAAPPALTTLFNFPTEAAGSAPLGVAPGPGGTLYGITQFGGDPVVRNGGGVVFQLTPPGVTGGAWAETALYAFTGQNGDGEEPLAGLTLGPHGVLYGTTYGGGSSGFGTVFQLAPPPVPGGAWTETILYSFTGGSDGGYPFAGVTLGQNGVLYGTTALAGNGTVFQLSPPTTAGGGWTETVLYSFQGGLDGAAPEAGVVLDPRGGIFGTTSAGGPADSGTVFELRPPSTSGGAWTHAVLYGFKSGLNDGAVPRGSSLTLGPQGEIFGTTLFGGTGGCIDFLVLVGCGTVFELTPPNAAGAPWTETVLHFFTGSASDGAEPYGGLVMRGGALYGTTLYGGVGLCGHFGVPLGCGTVFRLAPPAMTGGSWNETVLYRFQNGSDGADPESLTIGPGPAFYDVTAGGTSGFGVIFEFSL